MTSEDWQRALTVAARFHAYSFANTQLIWSQSMARGFTPTRVAGYRAWQKLNRHVRRGERGLAILAPLTRKVDTEEGEEERRLFGFKAVHVFDISQTDGEPLPKIRPARSAERRGGKECRSRWAPYHSIKQSRHGRCRSQ